MMARIVGGHGRDQRATPALHVNPEHAASVARPCPSVENRRCTPTVHTPRTPSAIRPWMPQHADLRRYKLIHDGTKKVGPVSREIPARGPSLQVVAGVGFEPT